MNLKLVVPVSVVAGLVITLIAGLVDVTPTRLLGAAWHGWPLVWFYVIVYPGSPISINWPNLIIDIILWSVIALIVAFGISKFEKTPKT